MERRISPDGSRVSRVSFILSGSDSAAVTINDETFVASDTCCNEEVEARFYAYAQTKRNDERRFTRVSFASSCGVTRRKIYPRAILFFLSLSLRNCVLRKMSGS